MQQAGFLTTFTEGLSFATVHHAGHEVPAYQPERALQLFRNYLDGSFFFNISSSIGDVGSTIIETSSSSDSSSSVDRVAIIAVSIVAGLLLLLVSVCCIYRFCAKKAFQYKLTEDLDDSKHSSAVVEL